MRYFILIFLILLQSSITGSQPGKTIYATYDIPLAGNAWFSKKDKPDKSRLGPDGLMGWDDRENEVWIYFQVNQPGEIQLQLDAQVNNGQSAISVLLDGIGKVVNLTNTEYKNIPVGRFKINSSGYQKVIIRGISKTGDVYANIRNLKINVSTGMESIGFVKDDFYWGRRGPSVHFTYTMPPKDIEWLYNEITVPEENDVIGSYFMANGFAEGYFGIQVNSASERRILFSVWSPFQTDDPDKIPDSQKIILIKKGNEVQTGEFGNEGSGGQSYKRFNWHAGQTYRFLTHIQPSAEEGFTEYSAYFYAPEVGDWQLIASFRRPQTNTYAKKFHSFLENFLTETGNINRRVLFTNQWVADTSGNWAELTEAKFTADATARKGNRMDYAGSVENNAFCLRNCGFFSPNVKMDTMMKRGPSGKKPEIDFSKIEKL